MKISIICAIILIFMNTSIKAEEQFGNKNIDSFSKSKQLLLKQVYTDNRTTIYCGELFDDQGQLDLPANFSEKYKNRMSKIEWEHVVPAENFGRSFAEWRDGHSSCVDNRGKQFKGRNCAEKMNAEYGYMQADMYNLFPAIGAVNALRQNYDFTLLPDALPAFNGCDFKIKGNKVEAPEIARGVIARTYLYFDEVYPKYNMSQQTKKLMQAWDKLYPVNDWECTRYKRIFSIQKSENPIMKARCD